MRVSTTTTISLDPEEEIPYTLQGIDYRVVAVAGDLDGRALRVYSRRVFANGRHTQGALRGHSLPEPARTDVANLFMAHAGVTQEG